MQYLEVKWSEFAQSCPTLCDPMDCSLQGFSVHGIFQARALEWVAISFSRGSSRPRDWTRGSHIASRHFYYLSHQGSPKQNFKEVIKLKWDPLSGSVILQDCCLYKKGRDIRNAQTQRNAMWGNGEEVGTYKPRREINQACWDFDLGLPASRNVRKYISIVYTT